MRAIFCVILAYYLFYVGKAIKPGRERNFYAGLFIVGSFLAIICGSILAALGK